MGGGSLPNPQHDPSQPFSTAPAWKLQAFDRFGTFRYGLQPLLHLADLPPDGAETLAIIAPQLLLEGLKSRCERVSLSLQVCLGEHI